MMSETATPAFSDISAQDTALAAQEAQEWIEAVTGRTFSSSFRKSLEDGVILCELMTKLYPDSIRRINRAKSPIAHLDNIQQFLSACKELGLNDAQLFDKMDLQETIRGSKATGVKRNEADRRIRSVCITLYWLGQTIAEMDDYSGPQLDLDAFKRIMYGDSTLNSVNSTKVSHRLYEEQPDHFQLNVEPRAPPPPKATGLVQWEGEDSPTENGHRLTLEQEQSADELIADIQRSVDEMLLGFQSPIVSPEPPSPAAKVSTIKAGERNEPVVGQTAEKVGLTIAMNSINGGFGFRIIGGRDINAEMIPQVDLVAPGLAADQAGLKEGDQLVSVNKQDISTLNHEALVSMIKKAGAEGGVMLGVIRTLQRVETDPPKYEKDDEVDFSQQTTQTSWEEQRMEYERQAREIALMYPRGPPPTVGSRPLPPLVEHQEEAVLEQINELLESTPIPPPQSTSPSPPPSPPTPTLSPQHTFSERQAAAQSPELQDDRESIEREIQELAAMEMAKPSEHSEEESSLASSSGKHESSLRVAAESPPVSAKQEAQETRDVEVVDTSAFQMPPLSSSEPSPLQTKKAEELEEDEDLEAHLQKLLEFSKMSNNDIVSLPPLIESPPPPLPQAEAPKRQQPAQTETVSFPSQDVSQAPATRPKPVRKAPSPPKPKPTKKGTPSKKSGNEESILSQRTKLPATAQTVDVRVHSVDDVETDESVEISPQRQQTPPAAAAAASEQKKDEKEIRKEETAEQVVVNVQHEEPVKSQPVRRPVFTPPPPPMTPPTSSPSPPASVKENKSTKKWNAIVDTTKVTETPAAAAAAAPPSPTPDSYTIATPSNSTPKSQAVSTYTTPVQSKNENLDAGSGSYHKEVEMRSQTSEDVEIIGEMKISRVQRLKWTPKGSLTEFVTSPSTPPRGPFQHQIQQHYSYPMQNGEAVHQLRGSDTQKPSKRAEVYQQRYSQPPLTAERTPPQGREDRSDKSKSMYQISHTIQQLSPYAGTSLPERQPWKSPQQELRIQHQQQNHFPQSSQQPSYHKHQPQQTWQQQRQQPTTTTTTMQQQYFSGQQPYSAGYRQNSMPNGHMGGGGYRSASLPRSRPEDWRVTRSNTWSAVDRSTKDGPQHAYAVKAGNPYELCSRCHQTLGGGPVMAIPGAKTQYHLQCFVCRMCRSPLVGSVPKNTLVIMKNRHPHCHRCVANNKDTIMTEC